MPTCVRSFSKINLGLAIGPVRADGFHELVTLYQTLAAHDLVTVAVERREAGAQDTICISSNDRRVPLDERNTVWKMMERVFAALDRGGAAGDHARLSVAIHIEKRLPVQGGLGAGSANAAAALVAFEREAGVTLLGEERLRIAGEVGSDVPLFLAGGAVLGLGRGELVVPVADLVLDEGEGRDGAAWEVVLALPEVGVSTPQAFREWDQAAGARMQGPPGLSKESASDRLMELSRALASALCEPHTSSGVFPAAKREGLARHPLSALVRTGIRNDFEEVVFRQHPFLGTIKRALVSAEFGGLSSAAGGALYAALSGSGSALFGLYADESAAQAAAARVEALGVRTMRTHLLGRSAYWRRMVVPEAQALQAGTRENLRSETASESGDRR